MNADKERRIRDRGGRGYILVMRGRPRLRILGAMNRAPAFRQLRTANRQPISSTFTE